METDVYVDGSAAAWEQFLAGKINSRQLFIRPALTRATETAAARNHAGCKRRPGNCKHCMLTNACTEIFCFVYPNAFLALPA